VATALSGQPISAGALTATSVTLPDMTIGDCLEVTTGGILTGVPCGGGGSGSGGVDLSTPNTWTSAQTFDGGVITNSITDNALTVGDCVTVGTGGLFTSASCNATGNANVAQANTWAMLQTFQAGLVASTVSDSALTPGMCVEAGASGVLESVACGDPGGTAGFAVLSQENIFTMAQEIDLASTSTIDGLQIYDSTIANGGSVNIIVGSSATTSQSAAVFGYTQSSSSYGTMGLNGGDTTTFDALGNWIMPGSLQVASITAPGITPKFTIASNGTAAFTSVNVGLGEAIGTTLTVGTSASINGSLTAGASTLDSVTTASVADTSLTPGDCLEASTNGTIIGVSCTTIAAAGVTSVTMLTDDGTLTVDGASTLASVAATTITDSGTLSVTGTSTLAGVTATSLYDSALTSGQCLEASTNGMIMGVSCSTIAATGITSVTTLTDTGSLTVDGSTTLTAVTASNLMATTITDSGLTTVGDCVIVGAGGLLNHAPCGSGEALLTAANTFTGEQTINGAATGLDVVSTTTTGTATSATFYSSIGAGTAIGTTVITVGNSSASGYSTVLGFYNPGNVTNPSTQVVSDTVVGEVGIQGGAMSTFDSLGNWTIPGEVNVTGTGVTANSLTDYALVNGECLIAGVGGLIQSEPCATVTGGISTSVANTWTALQTFSAGIADSTTLSVAGASTLASVTTTNITDSALTTVGDCVTVGTGGLLSQAPCGGGGVSLSAANTWTAEQTITVPSNGVGLKVTDNYAGTSDIAQFFNTNGGMTGAYIQVGYSGGTGLSLLMGFDGSFGRIGLQGDSALTEIYTGGSWIMPGYVKAANLYDTALTTVGDCVTVGTSGLLSQAACGAVIQRVSASVTSSAGVGNCTSAQVTGFSNLTSTSAFTVSGTSNNGYNVTAFPTYANSGAVNIFMCNGPAGWGPTTATAFNLVVTAF
jgi:hypothetical protein